MLKKISVIGFLVIIIGSMLYQTGVFAISNINTSGTNSDPIVTQSYVEMRIKSLQASIDQLIVKINNIQTTSTTPSLDMKKVYDDIDKYIQSKITAITPITPVSSNGIFAVIKVEKGTSIVCEASTEIILRSGSAVAIANASGDGLSDITVGLDVRGNEVIYLNHLLIVPKTDGRGIKINGTSYVMIKGTYQLITE